MWIWITFWTFVGLVAIAGILADVAKKRASIDLLKTAIEKGQVLDAQVIDSLLIDKDGPDHSDPVSGFRFIGLMCLSTGVGLPILGFFLSSLNDNIAPVLRGVGVLLICISCGWFAAAWFASKKAERAEIGK